MSQIRKGTEVRWKWGRSSATGKVTAVHRERVTRTIDGSKITKNGSRDEPAYEIEQDDGSRVLKLAGEVERAD